MDYTTLDYSEYVILPLQKETVDYFNLFMGLGCQYDKIKESISEYLYCYSYTNILSTPGKDEEIRKELFNIMVIARYPITVAQLNDLDRPVYYSLFNYYMSRLKDCWFQYVYRPDGVEVLVYDDEGEMVKNHEGAPWVDLYFSTHLFHDVKDGNIILRSVFS